MKYAVCVLPVAHVRASPDHRAEMVNQILFGESIKITAVDNEGWAEAESVYDGYRGFCRLNQFALLDDAIQELGEYTGDWVQEIFVNDKKMMIPFSCNLSLLKTNVPGCKIIYNGNIYNAGDGDFSEKKIISIASIFLNTAYLWGARSVYGIDCSGYSQSVFKMLGIALHRDASMQAEQGTSVGFLQEAKCGDLAFFDENDLITHVGILLNDHQIIHSSGNVRIDHIDNEGIVHVDTKKRTHRLRLIKRYF
jgi:hypothetical protein